MPNEKNLIRRYLIWCYKTTKEDLDRIDRYFTQEIVDDFILDDLTQDMKSQGCLDNEEYKTLLRNFDDYKTRKLQKARIQKYLDEAKGILTPNYLYLKNRLGSVEKAIKNFLGETALAEINELYEQEMTQRIISAREHQ